MFRCEECSKLFHRPVNFTEDTGEEFLVCPHCKTTSYEEVIICLVCDTYKTKDSIQNHICYECARKKYTVRLGLQFLDSHEEYYLWYYGIEKIDKDTKQDVIEILKKHYLDNIDTENDWNHYLEELKNYILDIENIYDWIKFLEENIYGWLYESRN